MRVRGEIHDLQLHIVWLNYVDLEIIAKSGGANKLASTLGRFSDDQFS